MGVAPMLNKLEARVTEHDRQIAAIRKLILAGMKMITASQAEIKALAASQKETDRMLKRLIESLERGRNGHKRADIH